jgi:hypothetical protein
MFFRSLLLFIQLAISMSLTSALNQYFDFAKDVNFQDYFNAWMNTAAGNGELFMHWLLKNGIYTFDMTKAGEWLFYNKIHWERFRQMLNPDHDQEDSAKLLRSFKLSQEKSLLKPLLNDADADWKSKHMAELAQEPSYLQPISSIREQLHLNAAADAHHHLNSDGLKSWGHRIKVWQDLVPLDQRNMAEVLEHLHRISPTNVVEAEDFIYLYLPDRNQFFKVPAKDVKKDREHGLSWEKIRRKYSAQNTVQGPHH